MWANFVFFYNFTDFLQNLEARVPQVLLMTLKFRIGISFEQGGDEEIFWHFKLFVMLKSILHKYWSTINKNYLDMFVQKKWNKQTNRNIEHQWLELETLCKVVFYTNIVSHIWLSILYYWMLYIEIKLFWALKILDTGLTQECLIVGNCSKSEFLIQSLNLCSAKLWKF